MKSNYYLKIKANKIKNMKLIFTLFLLICGNVFSQNFVYFNGKRLQDSRKKGGVPSSLLIIEKNEISNEKIFHYHIKPEHEFSCFGIGWEMDKLIKPEDIKVQYRTKNVIGEWTKWNELTAEFTPDDTPTGLFWTDAIFTTDAQSHSDIQLLITCPNSPESIKISLFDGNALTEEDSQNNTKPESELNDKSLTCPGFPAIITRAQWCGGSASCSQVNTSYTPTYINATHAVIHHGASPDTYTSGQTVVQSYYNYHVNTLGWTDIGYNYIVDKNGNFFQGRHNPNITNSDVQGAHAGSSNSSSIGINFPGNADVTIATTAQLDKVEHLLAWWFDFKGLNPLSSSLFQTQAFGIQTKPRICGHRDIGQTACPGNDLYSKIPALRTSVNQIITDCNTCGIPINLSTTSLTHNSATLNWTTSTNALSYTIQYKPTSSSTWITTTSTTNSKSITGLSSSTSYEFKVMSTCNGTTSNYSSVKTFTTLAPPQITLTMNNGTTAYSGHPYSSSYMDELSQYIITKQELIAAGWTSQTPVLKSIAFQVSTNSSTVLSSFTIKIAHTSATNYVNSSFISGSNTVTTYTGSITTSNGWNTYNFPTPFNYNNTSNLLITISFNNSATGTNSIVQSTILSEYKSNFRRENLASGTISLSAAGTRSFYRPNMRLVFGPSTIAVSTIKSTDDQDTEIVLMGMSDLKLIVFPNPINPGNTIQFSISPQLIEKKIKIDIIDQMGKLVYENCSYEIFDSKNVINLDSQIGQGSYFLQIHYEDGQIIEKFLVE